MALEKQLQDDLRQLRDWMAEHDRTLSNRAKNMLDTLHEFRRTDIQTLFEKNAQLVRMNTELTKSFTTLRQQVEAPRLHPGPRKHGSPKKRDRDSK